LREEIVDIRIRLVGEVKDRFQKIKRRSGLTNNTEVLRLVINYYYEKNFVEVQGVASEKARA
jgi:antitoxin component of RelBE/YafQ-DinJ toxin-antitoxin module